MSNSTKTATKRCTAAFLAAALATGLTTTSTYAQEIDGTTEPATNTISTDLGTCAPSAQIADAFLTDGYSLQATGIAGNANGSRPHKGLAILTQPDGGDWAIISVGFRGSSCVEYIGTSHEDKFINADSIRVSYTPTSEDSITDISFSTLVPPLRGCTSPQELNATLRDDMGLTAVFKGEMNNGDDAILYAPHFRGSATASGLFTLVISDGQEACNTVMGQGYKRRGLTP